MLIKLLKKNLLIIYYIIIFFPLIYSQNSNDNIIIDNCIFGYLSTNNEAITQLNDNILNSLISLNLPRLNENTVLMLFRDEFQIYFFKSTFCTNKFLENIDLIENYYDNNLHLFSIDLYDETDTNIVKLVIQTKKEFHIFYYENGQRLYNSQYNDIYYYIKTNIFPFFINKIFYYEEYQIFENQNLDIFNENEKIFNDICYIHETFNLTKPPELRRSLYFYKNDNMTYPLLNSINNCYIYNHSISYVNESFILEYKCKKNFNIAFSDIKIKNINIIPKDDINQYKGTNSLKDQKKILKCYKEAFKSNNIKNNIGFYLSFVLIIIVLISLIILIIQEYKIKFDEEIILEAPPKKKTLKESLKEKKENKSVKFNNNEQKIEIKKKSRKKKIKTSKRNDKENKQENNDDLSWYKNSIVIDSDLEKGNSQKEETNLQNSEKPKKHKKIKKIKKSKKNEENDLISKSSENKNFSQDDNDFNYKRKEKDESNKINSKVPDSYNKFKINSVIELKEKIKLRRLVIITNLGANLSKSNNIYNNNDNNDNIDIILKNKSKTSSRNIPPDKSFNNIMKNSTNNLMVNNNENELRKEKIGIIIGLEDKTFLSNIMRDYLNFEDALYFDRRDICDVFCHLFKLKNDFLNIFYFDYSFSPYTIRLIRFAFFFHFMLYLETLCIGEKYFFEKYYSKEFQEFFSDNNFYSKSRIYNNNYKNISLLEKDFKFDEIKFTKIQYLYTFKYSFPRVLIPAAISLISYIVTSLLSPRRKIMKILLNLDYGIKIKKEQLKLIANKYKIIFIFFSILAFALMIFFLFSITTYFYVFENAKYDIPQSFLLSGLLRFIFDLLLWSFINELRICSMQTHFDGFYNLINKIYEIN